MLYRAQQVARLAPLLHGSARQHRDMELRRNLAMEKTVIYLQACIRRWEATRLFRQLRAVKPVRVSRAGLLQAGGVWWW